MGQGGSPTDGSRRLRTIVEEPDVTAAAHAAALRFEKAHEGFEALKWAIARDPYGGTPLNGHAIFAQTLEGARSIDLPTITAVYVVSDDVITIKSVTFNEASSRA